jgi:hypothetical protein
MTTRTFFDDLKALVDTEIPGGCDTCADPVQILTKHETGIWILTTHHDDDCPTLARYQGRRP